MASLDLALGTAAQYGLKPDEARTIASEVSAALFGGSGNDFPRRGVPARVKSTSRILKGWTTKRRAIAIINRNYVVIRQQSPLRRMMFSEATG
jgi:hypothetical protein